MKDPESRLLHEIGELLGGGQYDESAGRSAFRRVRSGADSRALRAAAE